MNRSRMLRVGSILAVIGMIAIAFQWLPMENQVNGLLEWIDRIGYWGPVWLAVAYIVATVLLVPGSLLTLGAGALFGVVVGTITISIGSTFGAIAAMMLGRTLLRKQIERRFGSDSRFTALDESVGREGFKIVLLTRLSPILPFNVLNYAFGPTKVSIRDYALASWIGMLPGTIAYVYIGSTLGSLAELATGRAAGSPVQWGLFIFGLLATVVLSIYLARLATAALRRADSTDTLA